MERNISTFSDTPPGKEGECLRYLPGKLPTAQPTCTGAFRVMHARDHSMQGHDRDRGGDGRWRVSYM